MFDLIPSWMSWVLGGSMVSLVVLALLVPSVFKVLETALTVVTPILSTVGKALADGLAWVLNTIIGPGLRDILEDWVTVVTVLLMGLALWGYMDAKQELLERRMQAQLTQCQMTVKTLKKCVGVPAKVTPVQPKGWSLF